MGDWAPSSHLLMVTYNWLALKVWLGAEALNPVRLTLEEAVGTGASS